MHTYNSYVGLFRMSRQGRPVHAAFLPSSWPKNETKASLTLRPPALAVMSPRKIAESGASQTAWTKLAYGQSRSNSEAGDWCRARVSRGYGRDQRRRYQPLRRRTFSKHLRHYAFLFLQLLETRRMGRDKNKNDISLTHSGHYRGKVT